MHSWLLKAGAAASFLMVLASGYYFLSPSPQQLIVRGVYFWKTSASFDYNYSEDSIYPKFISDHRVKKIYVKVLDVDWNAQQGIVPVSKTYLSRYSDGADHLFPAIPQDSSFSEYPAPYPYAPPVRSYSPFSFVPVVYITNRAIAHLDSSVESYIANKIVSHLLRMQQCSTYPIREIQVDCDWSALTRERYFSLLKAIKKITGNYTLSVTIRLHQYRNYKITGVPPCDRGMLMLYNIGNAALPGTANSIFSYDEAVKYLPRNHVYPLPLDLALPVFSWGIVFANGKFRNLINDLNLADAAGRSFLQQKTKNTFTVTADTLFKGAYLRPGYTIKIEQCYDKELAEAAAAALRVNVGDTFTVSLFDLNHYDLKNIRYESIENAYSR